MVKVTKIYEENHKSVAFELVNEAGQTAIWGRDNLLQAINEGVVVNAKAYMKGSVPVITVAKDVPKAPYEGSSSGNANEAYFKKAIRYGISYGKCIVLTGCIALDFRTPGDYNQTRISAVVDKYNKEVLPDRRFNATKERYVDFVIEALKGMEFYLGIVDFNLAGLSKMIISSKSEDVFTSIVYNRDIREWWNIPNKSAVIYKFLADGRMEKRDIGDRVWGNRGA